MAHEYYDAGDFASDNHACDASAYVFCKLNLLFMLFDAKGKG